jgi:AcrR family transcriptional regulator
MTRGLQNTDSQIRTRLIDSALEIIDRDGVDGARLRDIVEHAGMTTGSLYWFFKNRRALINAALAERYIRKMRQLTDVAEDIINKGLVIGDPLELLAEITVKVSDAERALARRERVQVLAAALDDPILAKQVADVQRTLLAQLTSVIRSTQEMGIIRSDVDAYSVAVMIQSTAVGLASVDLAPDLLPADRDWIYLMERVVNALRTPGS